MNLKRTCYLFSVLINSFLHSSNCYSQSYSYFKTFGDVAPDNWYMNYPYIDTFDQNSYILTGFLQKLNTIPSDTFSSSCSFVSKKGLEGTVQWEKTYKTDGAYTILKSFCVSQNKEIITGGALIHPSYPDQSRGILMKLDSLGNIDWSKQVADVQINDVTSLEDNTVAFVGFDSVHPYWTTIVGKISNTGNLLWANRIWDNYQFADFGIKVIEGNSGDLLVVGMRENSSAREAMAVLFDAFGNLKNELILAPTSASDQIIMINACADENGGFLIVGTGPGNVGYEGGPMIIRTDANLNVKWKNHYYTTDIISEFIDVAVFNKNEFLILTEPEGHGSNQSFYLKRFGFSTIDSSGVLGNNYLISEDTMHNMPWNFKLMKSNQILFTGHSGQKLFYGITDTTTAGFCGFKNIDFYTHNPNVIYKTGMIVDTISLVLTPLNITVAPFDQVEDWDGCDAQFGVGELTVENEWIVYPVPSHDYLYLKFGMENPITNLCLYDYLGREVISFTNFTEPDIIKLNFQTIPGIHFIKVEFSNGLTSSRVIFVE